MVGRSRQQQLSAAVGSAHGKKNGIALGLLDLVDPQAQQSGPQLLHHRLHTDSIQWHGLIPPS